MAPDAVHAQKSIAVGLGSPVRILSQFPRIAGKRERLSRGPLKKHSRGSVEEMS
jgi:hypothetical protein